MEIPLLINIPEQQIFVFLVSYGEAVVSLLLLLALMLFFYKHLQKKSISIDSAEIGLGSSKLVIKASHEELQLAYDVWVELSTRKIALPFDDEHDSVHGIHQSWYDFFSITRELLKKVPARKLRAKQSLSIVTIVIRVLNEVIRPYLTKWHGKFDSWEASQSSNSHPTVPEEKQKEFPEYAIMIEELKTVNRALVNYKKELERFVF